MKFTADKSQVMEIYCDWLKNNCECYEYLTDEARALCLKIKSADSQSMEAKEYYLKFLSMFVNNPFVVASRLCKSRADQTDQSEKQIVSIDYRCYFIKNRYGMWLPFELYCWLATYRNDGELVQMQEQEQIKLSEDYQDYQSLSDSQEEVWMAEEESWQECFVSFLKGPQEVKIHPVTAVLAMCFGGLVLLRLYQSYKEELLPELFSAGGRYAAIVSAAGLFAVYVMIQGFLEFGNISIKRKVRSHIQQAEELKKSIREKVKSAAGISGDLREFVTQMLKYGKEGISRIPVLRKLLYTAKDRRVKRMRRLVRIAVFTVMWVIFMSLTSLGAQNENGVDMVAVIDTSGSMNNTDPDRISIDAAKLFIDMMEVSGSRAGVVSFSDKLGTVTELTPMNSVSDKDKMKVQISSIWYGGDTDIGMAAQEGVRLLREAQNIDNQQMLLLFTDGTIDLTGTDEAQREADSLENAKAAAADAKNAGISIYTIGLNANGKVDQSLLTDMAARTGGRSYVVDSAGDLPQIFNEIFADFVNSNIVNLGEYETDGTNFTEIPVDIPNNSVLEANIIMLSTSALTEVEMTEPDGNVIREDGSKMILSRSDQYSMLKLVMPMAGNWKLRIKSSEGCRVHVNLIFNYKVSLKGSARLETAADGTDVIAVKGYLEKEGVILEDQALYQQFTGSVEVLDGEGERYTYPLSINGCSFEGSVPVTGTGTYKIILRIDSETMYRESEEIEFPIENHGPIVTKELDNPMELKGLLGIVVKKKLDLNQYFTDPDGDKLTFEIEMRSGYGKAELNDKGELTLTPSKNGEDLLTVSALDGNGLSVRRQVPVMVQCTIMGILPLLFIPVVLLVLIIVLLKIKRAAAVGNAVWYGKIRWMVVKGTGFGGGSREQVYDMGYERGTVPLSRIVTDPSAAGLDLNKVALRMNGKTNASIYIQNHSKKCRMSSGFGGSETAAAELNSGDFVMLAGGSEGMEITVKVTYSLTAY